MPHHPATSAERAAPLILVLALIFAVPVVFLILVGAQAAQQSDDCASTTAHLGALSAADLDISSNGAGDGTDDETGLDDEQLSIAAQVVTAVRAFPPTAHIPHAAVVALATARQESGLRNLDYGDRDSLGVFQQRPSQGWGTTDQVTDVAHATTTFLTHLVQVPGWATMRVTDAAATVQRPAEQYRGLYEQWVPLATRLTDRLWPHAADLGGAAVTAVVDTPATSATSACPPTGAGTGSVVYPVPPQLAHTDQRNWGTSGAHWSSWHTGTDFAVPCGTPVLAATAGTVEIDTTQPWAGPHLVKIVTGPTALATWYAHMETVDVTTGETVTAGEQIGRAGDLGNATGCHLHFEVHLHNGTIYGPDNTDPTTWLTTHVGHGPQPTTSPGTGLTSVPGGPSRLTLMTYNIHVGAEHGRDLDQVAADIAASRASVVVLNEIDHYPGYPPQAQQLARILHMHYAWGPNARLGRTQRGNAILSEFPISDVSNTALPWHPGTERRGLLSADLDVNGTPVEINATHLHYTGTIRLLQARRVAQLVGHFDCPTFLLGDMNSTPSTAMHAALTAHLTDTYTGGTFGPGSTSEAAHPRKRIDYIFYNHLTRPATAQVMPRWTSDHRAVRATFSISSGTAHGPICT